MRQKQKNYKKNCIFVKGAREHNLQNIDVTIPRDKLIVITGILKEPVPPAAKMRKLC